MVSKTHKQRQKRKEKLRENGGVMPPVTPCTPKSIHLKKTRPRMKGKKKIRLGLECPVDIYEGFDEKKGVNWRCPQCGKLCRVVGFCVDCASGVKSKVHEGVLMASRTAAAKRSSAPVAKKAPLNLKSAMKKKLKLKKK